MGLNVAILLIPVLKATKELPISRCKFSTLTPRQPMVEFLLTHVLTLSARDATKSENPALTRIELTSSARAGMLVTS